MKVNAVIVAVVLSLSVFVIAHAHAQTADTFAQRLEASQTAKRAINIAAIRATRANRVLYVRTSGNDANNGTSRTRAVRTIQRAINLVRNTGTSIVVGPGTYPEALTFTAATRSGTSGSRNTIFADVTGALTGDIPGEVIVSGSGGAQALAYGLTMQSCSFWSFRWLTFTGQSIGNVYIIPTRTTGRAAVAGLIFDACTFNITPRYGLLGYYLGDVTVNDCTFARTAASGTSLSLNTISASNLIVTNNRINRTGSLYDTSGYKNGSQSSGPGGNSGTSSGTYGVIAMATGSTRTTVRIQNNIVSDASIGLYTYAHGGAHTLRVANNTVVSCYYGLYTYGHTRVRGTLSNNIIGNCYLGSYTHFPLGSIAGQIEWNINYLTLYPSFAATYQTSHRRVASVSDFVTDQTPVFVAAPTGDFTLGWGGGGFSAGIDSGVPTNAPTTDAAGVARPADGNGDGTLAVDFGAVESPLTRRLRVVRWHPVSIDD